MKIKSFPYMFLKEWKGNLRGLRYVFHSNSFNFILEGKGQEKWVCEQIAGPKSHSPPMRIPSERKNKHTLLYFNHHCCSLGKTFNDHLLLWTPLATDVCVVVGSVLPGYVRMKRPPLISMGGMELALWHAAVCCQLMISDWHWNLKGHSQGFHTLENYCGLSNLAL